MAAPLAAPVPNTLYYGDNLEILRRYPRIIDDESVDLIYLDPPFNSNADYNVLFAERDDAPVPSEAQARMEKAKGAKDRKSVV